MGSELLSRYYVEEEVDSIVCEVQLSTNTVEQIVACETQGGLVEINPHDIEKESIGWCAQDQETKRDQK